jgi:hypothetical protein
MAGYDWIPAGGGNGPIVRGSALGGMGRWCPETGFTQCHGGTWSPQLGRFVSIPVVPTLIGVGPPQARDACNNSIRIGGDK